MPTNAPQSAEKSATSINLRLSIKLRDLIDNAAALVGKTRTEFMLESARQHAIDVLLDQRLFALDQKQSAAFLKALDNPPEPGKRLKALFKEAAPWERTSR